MTTVGAVPHRDALFSLCDRIPADWPWAVTASANLALRGFDVEPGDVDIVADGETVHDIADLFAESVVRRVVPPEAAEGAHIRSHFGALELGDTEVESMGDVEHRIDGEWVPDPAVKTRREFLPTDGREIPVLALEAEARGYRARGERERAARIERRR